MMRRTLLGDEHPHVAGSLNKLTLVLQAQGKLVAVEELFREALEHARGRLPQGDPQIATFLAQFGSFQLQQGKYAEAEVTLRECLSIRADKLRGDWRHCVAMSLLGGALAGQSKHEEAEPLLRDGYQKMKPPPEATFRKREALERLIKHYEAWGKADEAARYRKVLEVEAAGNGK